MTKQMNNIIDFPQPTLEVISEDEIMILAENLARAKGVPVNEDLADQLTKIVNRAAEIRIRAALLEAVLEGQFDLDSDGCPICDAPK